MSSTGKGSRGVDSCLISVAAAFSPSLASPYHTKLHYVDKNATTNDLSCVFSFIFKRQF